MTITTRDSLLTIRGLSASVDETPILHDIDLAVGPGETHVIMGPNGAGKSTLGHVVMGDAAYRVDGGSVEFDGRDITDLSPDKRSRAGLFLSFQAPVEIPGVPLSSFLRATVAGRDGKELKGKQFKKHVRALADELDMDPSFLDRELGGLEIGTWTKPHGGYFISFDSLNGWAKEIVARCKKAGVVMTGAGATYPYGKDPEDRNIRIAPSYPPLQDLIIATELFALCVKLVSVNKLLEEM